MENSIIGHVCRGQTKRQGEHYFPSAWLTDSLAGWQRPRGHRTAWCVIDSHNLCGIIEVQEAATLKVQKALMRAKTRDHAAAPGQHQPGRETTIRVARPSAPTRPQPKEMGRERPSQQTSREGMKRSRCRGSGKTAKHLGAGKSLRG